MDLGENFITFQVSRNGMVLYSPKHSVISTSLEMQSVLDEIAGKTAKYVEDLLREKFSKVGKEGD